MSEKFDKLSQSLTKHLPEPSVPVVQQNQSVLDKDVTDDYEYSRETYKKLIDNSSEALNGMLALASESEHPRAYEVLSGMVKNIADVTDKLMDLQKKKDDMITKHQKPSQGGVTNNNVFVGSTTDLQRMLMKGDVIDHDQE